MSTFLKVKIIAKLLLYICWMNQVQCIIQKMIQWNRDKCMKNEKYESRWRRK